MTDLAPRALVLGLTDRLAARLAAACPYTHPTPDGPVLDPPPFAILAVADTFTRRMAFDGMPAAPPWRCRTAAVAYGDGDWDDVIEFILDRALQSGRGFRVRRD